MIISLSMNSVLNMKNCFWEGVEVSSSILDEVYSLSRLVKYWFEVVASSMEFLLFWEIPHIWEISSMAKHLISAVFTCLIMLECLSLFFGLKVQKLTCWKGE